MKKIKREFLIYNGIKIDKIIFEQGFVSGCNVSICGGECCDWGVYIDKDFKEVILKHKKEIIDVMDEFQLKNPDDWFENKIKKDSDFPSGYCVGTNTYQNKYGKTQCVFKDKFNYCSLQVAEIKNKLHHWELKPFYCTLYPLTLIDNTLTYDDEHSKRLSFCGIKHKNNFVKTVFEAMREEIKYIFGNDFYNYLNDYFLTNYKQKSNFE